MNEKMAIIASYEGIFEIAQKAASELNCDIKLIYGELSEGVKKAKPLITSEPHRIIISRGGTACLLKKHFHIPIVEIKITGYDILKVLYPFIQAKKDIAVVGFENTIKGTLEIAEILCEEIKYIPVLSETELETCLFHLKEKGVQAIVGDGLAVRRAKQMGFETKLIESGAESVFLAIEEAAKLYQAMDLERIKSRRYEAILNSIDEGVISIDTQGVINIFNPGAEKIFQIKKEIALGKKISNIIPSTKMLETLHHPKEKYGQIQQAGKYTIATNHIPIMIDNKLKGAVSTFEDITKIQQLEAKIRAETVKKGFQSKNTFQDIIYKSHVMKETILQAKEYAKTDSTILILGESGTGKEIVAQAIHNESARSYGPFVAINCAALPDSLLESELFGYVEGAFTGARKNGKKGLFEMAHQGTILLDEISEMNLSVQARFLRVIQEKEVMRIGDDQVIPIDVRIITATNKKLWQCVLEGAFRQDLYYRINVLNVNIPPLRKRKEDIIPLCHYFLEKLAHKYHKPIGKFSEEEISLLQNNLWMGNVRELQNVLERFVISGKIHMELYEEPLSKQSLTEGTLSEIELRIIKKVLSEENYHKSNTAKRLGITRMTLDKKLSFSNPNQCI